MTVAALSLFDGPLLVDVWPALCGSGPYVQAKIAEGAGGREAIAELCALARHEGKPAEAETRHGFSIRAYPHDDPAKLFELMCSQIPRETADGDT